MNPEDIKVSALIWKSYIPVLEGKVVAKDDQKFSNSEHIVSAVMSNEVGKIIKAVKNDVGEYFKSTGEKRFLLWEKLNRWIAKANELEKIKSGGILEDLAAENNNMPKENLDSWRSVLTDPPDYSNNHYLVKIEVTDSPINDIKSGLEKITDTYVDMYHLSEYTGSLYNWHKPLNKNYFQRITHWMKVPK